MEGHYANSFPIYCQYTKSRRTLNEIEVYIYTINIEELRKMILGR